MKSHSNKSYSRTWKAELFGVTSLLLCVGSIPSARSQTPAANGTTTPKAPVFKTDTDTTDLQDGIRNGSLFYATAPLSEEALRRLDGTPNEASVTVPLTVDRVHNRLSVQARINNRSVHLILDTGAGPHVTLNEVIAHGIKLTNKAPVQIFGSQGIETITQGLAQSLTLGRLMLRQIVAAVSHNVPFYNARLYNGTLGTQVFKHYRVTLDFAAQTMTLTRGGVLTLPKGSAALSLPFDDDDGYIFVPARVLDQAGWALLDSGSDMTSLSFKAAKAAAKQLPPADAKTAIMDQRIGMGNTAKKFNIILLKVPVPISLNTGHEDAEFNTTSRFGMSDTDDVLDPAFGAHGDMNALLGFPFFLQFQRVVIDYPTHTLILQYPARDTPKEVADFPTKHERAWPGYKWRQKGYAWIEVPDGKNPSPAIMPATALTPVITTITQTTREGLTTVTTMSDGGIVVNTVGETTSVRHYPAGSTLKIDDTDHTICIIPPPGSANPVPPAGGK